MRPLETKSIGFIGVGRMGWPIASHLVAKGFRLTVCDTNQVVAAQFAEQFGARCAKDISTLAADTQVLISSVPADVDLLNIARGLSPTLTAVHLWIDHSTTSARIAREVASQVHAQGASFLDAPVSGGVDGAKAASLTVMVGGEPNAFDRAQPIMQAYSARQVHMGSAGAGQVTKMTNQICVAGLCQALAEGLDFAETAGLDVRKVIHVMLQGSSASWQMANRAHKMLEGEYEWGFATALMRKDLALILEEARHMDVPLPATSMVDQFLAEVSAMGGKRWDWCSLMERQRRRKLKP
jgi:3-hydroxyisobutyrate dehydrogenase-like beta-hydroxyacid dehydrogenase